MVLQVALTSVSDGGDTDHGGSSDDQVPIVNVTQSLTAVL